MTHYVVRGLARGTLYSGPSLETALETLRRDSLACRLEHQGPTDARLYVDGRVVETELQPDGLLRIIPPRDPVELPPSSMSPKWPRH